MRALEAGLSLSEWINRVLRRILAEQPEQRATEFALITFGPTEPQREFEPAELAQALEQEEAEALKR